MLKCIICLLRPSSRQSCPFYIILAQYSTTMEEDITDISSLGFTSFGEGLYKPSMDEDPWKYWNNRNKPVKVAELVDPVMATTKADVTAVGDIWMGENTTVGGDDTEGGVEVKGLDGGAWNPEEI